MTADQSVTVEVDEVVSGVMRRLAAPNGGPPAIFLAVLAEFEAGDFAATGLANLEYFRTVIATTCEVFNEIAAGAREIRLLTEPDRHRPTAPDVSE
jgi:hypothetical protein